LSDTALASAGPFLLNLGNVSLHRTLYQNKKTDTQNAEGARLEHLLGEILSHCLNLPRLIHHEVPGRFPRVSCIFMRSCISIIFSTNALAGNGQRVFQKERLLRDWPL
jgi:hypothetical protein